MVRRPAHIAKTAGAEPQLSVRLSRKFVMARARLVASVPSVVARYVSTTRANVANVIIPFVVGAIHILRKVCSRNIFVALSKLRKAFSDESIVVAVIEHYSIIRALNRSDGRTLTKRYPHYVNKYVHPYLAKSLSKKARREALRFHHQYLTQRVVASFYEQILQNRLTLWSELIDEDCYAISMSFNPDWHAPGDLSLSFERNNTPIYEISFAIVPGGLIGCSADPILLVARVQGGSNQAEAIRIATRACHRIAPPHLLMAAVQSIATVLAIDTIGGITNKEQLAKSPQEKLNHFFFDYDAFWETFTFRYKGIIAYEIQVPFLDKPGAHAGYHSKARLRRRHFKNQIAAIVGATFAKKFVKSCSS